MYINICYVHMYIILCIYIYIYAITHNNVKYTWSTDVYSMDIQIHQIFICESVCRMLHQIRLYLRP